MWRQYNFEGKCIEVFHFRWLNIKRIYAAFLISIAIFPNNLKRNSFQLKLIHFDPFFDNWNKFNMHFDPLATFVKNIFEIQSQLNLNISQVDQTDLSFLFWQICPHKSDFKVDQFLISAHSYEWRSVSKCIKMFSFNFSIHFLFMYMLDESTSVFVHPAF